MARAIDIQRIIRSRFVRDLPLVALGCAIAALAVDVFMVPQGLAAGGLTGLATIVAELGRRAGLNLPVGTQTIVMNAVLLLFVLRTGGARYAVQTITGFVLFGFFTDLFAPFVAPLGERDLMLCALWGGIISGLGYGLVFRCGVNTGGSDTIAQIISRKTSLPVGSTVMAIDVAVCAASAPVFSLENALYAAIAMVLMGMVVDRVVDGADRRRMAFVISEQHERIADDVMYEMGRGVTEVQARGVWSGKDRPMLLIILDRRELSILKTVVAEHDPEAIVFIADVSEAIGEGFKELNA
ncbi:YitT family protein [Candidatus Collinsella stercoripullorum]|uniref:YitT family protein n=1 Tax=Candidatus Collinsella stercoripullorum TaxID=2838522 RepID=UPI0022E85CC0|nr:YitT family protein [Candidatus Collinsella stercoripullorum]